jgi:hypothetical protein
MIERVRGTPARLEDRLHSLATDLLVEQREGRWSIQENAGHLLDLESLFSQRLDEYLAGVEVLHAADMSNRKTYEASHNQVEISLILGSFREQRGLLTARLDQLPADVFSRVARHPRLNVSMRLVDMLYFQSEHDDYHLARITELVKQSAES